MALLAVDDPAQIDPGRPDQPAAELDAELRLAKGSRKVSKGQGKRIADRLDIELPVAGKVRDAESAAKVADRQRLPGRLGKPRRERERVGLRLDHRRGVERLASGEDVKTAPSRSELKNKIKNFRNLLDIDPEGLGTPAHLHSR